jgi:hypothetical protein
LIGKNAVGSVVDVFNTSDLDSIRPSNGGLLLVRRGSGGLASWANSTDFGEAATALLFPADGREWKGIVWDKEPRSDVGRTATVSSDKRIVVSREEHHPISGTSTVQGGVLVIDCKVSNGAAVTLASLAAQAQAAGADAVILVSQYGSRNVYYSEAGVNVTIPVYVMDRAPGLKLLETIKARPGTMVDCRNYGDLVSDGAIVHRAKKVGAALVVIYTEVDDGNKFHFDDHLDQRTRSQRFTARAEESRLLMMPPLIPAAQVSRRHGVLLAQALRKNSGRPLQEYMVGNLVVSFCRL